MASGNPISTATGSESIPQVLVPLAQPETSDSAMETSSDDAVSNDSREQKTDSLKDPQTQTTDMPTPEQGPISEAESCLSSATLEQETPSDASDKCLISEGGSGTSAMLPQQDESKHGLDQASGTSSFLSKAKSTNPSDERVLEASGPSTSKGISSSGSSEPFVSAEGSLLSSLPPSEGCASVPENKTVSDISTRRNAGSEAGPSDPAGSTFECSSLWNPVLRFLQTWQAYSIFLTDSIFLLPLQYLLLVIAITSVAVGSSYINECPVAKEIPVLLIILGCVGFLAVCFRTGFLIYNFRSMQRCYVPLQRKLIISVNTVFLILFAAELYTYFTVHPTFNPGSKDFCDYAVFTYAFIANCWIIIFTIVMFAIHLPAFLFYAFHIGGPGLPEE